MHEHSLLADLMSKVGTMAQDAQADTVTTVRVRLGALAHISPDHLREHFEEAARGTIAEGADLEVITNDDISDPFAQEIILESIDVAE